MLEYNTIQCLLWSSDDSSLQLSFSALTRLQAASTWSQ